MRQLTSIPEPLNTEERYAYAMVERLDEIIKLLSKDEPKASPSTKVASNIEVVTTVKEPLVAQEVQEKIQPKPRGRGRKKEV